ncbi:MAG: HigA family addiction module antidote protein [Pseudomonadales bacterium]|nr:HigA family addiction module antidote protein [Pseudomonadales bacterium]
MSIQQYNPPHPGGFIKRVYLEPYGLGSNEVSAKLQVSASTFNRLINEKSDVSPEMALKLSKVIGRSPESWLLMQDNFNLSKAKNKIDLSNYDAIKFAI